MKQCGAPTPTPSHHWQQPSETRSPLPSAPSGLRGQGAELAKGTVTNMHHAILCMAVFPLASSPLYSHSEGSGWHALHGQTVAFTSLGQVLATAVPACSCPTQATLHVQSSYLLCLPAVQVQQVLQNIAMQLPSAPPQILARASAGSGDHAMQMVGTPTSTSANPGLASIPSLPPQAASEAHSLAQASSTLKAQAQTLKVRVVATHACPGA